MYFGVLRLVQGLHLGEGVIRKLPKRQRIIQNQKQGRLSSNFQLRQKIFEKVEGKVVIWLCPSYP